MIIIQNKDNFKISENIELSKLFKQDAINIYGNHTLNENWILTYSDYEFIGEPIDKLKLLPETIKLLNEYNSNKKDLLTILNTVLDGKYSESCIIKKHTKGSIQNNVIKNGLYYYTDGYDIIFNAHSDIQISEYSSSIYETKLISEDFYNHQLLKDENIAFILKEYNEYIFHLFDDSGKIVGIKVNDFATEKIEKYRNNFFVKLLNPTIRKQKLLETKQYTKTISEKKQMYYKITFNKISCMLTSEETVEIQNKFKNYFDNIEKNQLQEILNNITK
jgi:hypothetical protein